MRYFNYRTRLNIKNYRGEKFMKNTINTRLSNLTAIWFLCAFMLLTTACDKSKTSYIFVLDLTESVSPQARENSFAAIKLRAKNLKRGDSLTVIPINSDAQTETSGKVLHLKTSEKRELADADLEEFFTFAEQKLGEMSANAKSYKQSDILGAIRIVQEEINLIDTTKNRVVVAILSDMVHSTAQIRFESDANFTKTETARKYVETAVQNSNCDFQKVEFYIGFLESSDWRKMSAERREAVRAFWQEYFTKAKTKRLQFATDGTGQLENFVTENLKK